MEIFIETHPSEVASHQRQTENLIIIIANRGEKRHDKKKAQNEFNQISNHSKCAQIHLPKERDLDASL